MVIGLLAHARLGEDLADVWTFPLVHLKRTLHDELDSDVVGLRESSVELLVCHVIGVSLVEKFPRAETPHLACLDIALVRTSSGRGHQSLGPDERSGEHS